MLLTALVPLITFPYLSRIFLAEGMGKLNFVASVIQLFTLIAQLGVYTYGVREGTKIRDNKELFSSFACELLLINVFSTLLSYTIFIGSIIFIPTIHQYKTLLLVEGISIGFASLGLDWIYGVYEDYFYITVRQICMQLFSVFAMFLFVHDTGDLQIWAIILTITSAGSNFISIIYARKYVIFKLLFKVRCRHILVHLKPILFLFATSFASKVYCNLDTILLGFLTNDYHVGIYSAAIKVNSVLITCFVAISPVFIPQMIIFANENNKKKLALMLKRLFQVVFCLIIPIVVGCVFESDEIISLLSGDAFLAASLTMRILAPIILINTCTNILYYNYLVIYNKEKEVLRCTVIGGLINLFISVILVPYYKENGAAIGSLISEIATLIIAFLYCKKNDKNFMGSFPSIRNYLIGSIVIVGICMISKRIIYTQIISFFIAVILSVIGYFAVLFITKDYAVAFFIGRVNEKLHKRRKINNELYK